MHFPSAFVVAALAYLGSCDLLKPRNFETHDYFTLHLRRNASPESVAAALGLRYEGRVGELPDHYYFSARQNAHSADQLLQDVHNKHRKREAIPVPVLDDVLWSQKSALKPRLEKRGAIPMPAAEVAARKAPSIPGSVFDSSEASTQAIAQRQQIALKLEIRDPIFADQWHLFNSVELGHDVNVTGLWMEGITGHNSTVAVVDDGLDMYSDDLRDNYFAEGSYDFNDHTDEPRPRLPEDHHGTRCAGEIAAVRNNVCGVGVAYDSKVAGLRILSKSISDEDEAVAINYEMQRNQIYSCSWGPPDNGKAMDAPGTLIKRAILNGIQNGRGGKGSVFVFAAGNGAAADDNCNFDGYTNSIYSITVGAIDRKGLHPYYSEKCSAGLVVTYSSGSGDAIHTTDVGASNCYNKHGGTSAAAPLAAGIFALVFSVRPDLTWRDMQYLCVNTAVPINEHEEWATLYSGKKYSHTYSYGKLDAYALVEAAKTWKSVKPQAWYKSPWQHVKTPIPQGVEGLSSSFTITKKMLEDANLERLEHVTITMNIEHSRRGDLSVDLISPHNVVSHISTARRNDEAPRGYVDWTFMSVAHWGEPGEGTWTVIVKDTKVNAHIGIFTDWRISLWGESIDPKKATLHPMPDGHEDDDHDRIDAIVSTTSVAPHTETELPAHPSDHPDRPVNNKPEDKPTEPSAESSSTASASGTASSDADTPTSTFFLPSIFPTFGVSPRTQVWVYGAIGAILIFCVGLGIFFCVLRRRRSRISRADYEFEIIDDKDGSGAGQPLSGGARPKRRAGELYDAFAGESDEEIFSGDEEDDDEEEERVEGAYRDEEPQRQKAKGKTTSSPPGEYREK